MDVLLNFINQSEARTGNRIVLFQKNHPENQSAYGKPVAWRVLHISGKDAPQRLHVSTLLSVAAKNAAGMLCEQHLTTYNQRWDVISARTRDWLIPSGDASKPDHIEVRNTLQREAITAQVYKDGRLLAEETGVAPRMTVDFRFDNVLWVGITGEDVREGDRIPPGRLKFVTELPLEGFSKADLILSNTGDEYRFRLIPVAEKAVLVK